MFEGKKDRRWETSLPSIFGLKRAGDALHGVDVLTVVPRPDMKLADMADELGS